MKTVYIQPLAGLEPIRADVVYDGKTYMVVTYGFGFEQTLNKKDPSVIIEPTESSYWSALRNQEMELIDKLQKEIAWREQRRVAFHAMAEQKLKTNDEKL